MFRNGCGPQTLIYSELLQRQLLCFKPFFKMSLFFKMFIVLDEEVEDALSQMALLGILQNQDAQVCAVLKHLL